VVYGWDGSVEPRTFGQYDIAFNAYVGDKMVGSVWAEDWNDAVILHSIYVLPDYRTSDAFMALVGAVQQAVAPKKVIPGDFRNPRLEGLVRDWMGRHSGVPGDQIEIREVEPNDFYISYDGEIHTRRDPTTDMYYFNAYVDQELVGSIHARPRHDLGTMVIYEAFVKPEYRSSPAFMKLVNAVQEVSGGLPLEGYGIANPRLRDLYNRRYTGWMRESHTFELKKEQTKSWQFGDLYAYRLYADGAETDGEISYTVSTDEFEPTVWVNSVFVPGNLRGTNAFLTLLEPIFALKRDGWKIEADFANPRLGELYERWMARQGALDDRYSYEVRDAEQGERFYFFDGSQGHRDVGGFGADETVMNVYDGGKIIGTLIGGERYETKGVFTVVNVYVDPAYRNTTALYDLILAAKQMATSRGLILRGSSILNEKLMRVYERWLDRQSAMNVTRKVESRTTLYHVSPAENASSIREHGLTPEVQHLPMPGGRPYPYLWLWNDYESAKRWATMAARIRDYDIYHVDATDLHLQRDPHEGNKFWSDAWATQDRIPPERIVGVERVPYSEGASREERGRWSRIAMPLGPEEGQNFKAQRPWLYHQTDREYIPKILDEG
jgi:GNAT superfamily N-acetyltransferase